MDSDLRDYDAALEAIAQGEETVPAEVVYAILDGKNPVRVWREYRALTQRSANRIFPKSKRGNAKEPQR